MTKISLNGVWGKVGGIAGFLIGFAIVGAILGHNNIAPSNPTALTTDTSWRPYTSTAYGFNVEFPGNPTASNNSLDVQGVSVPYTNYERDNDSSYWVTEVFDYPSQFDMSDVNARLEGALNGSVENTQGATLANSSFTTMAGYTAINGKLVVQNGNGTINEYVKGFLKGNQMFYFIGSGATESDFNYFTNSFRFQ
jgi:hypothetical protein